MKPLSMLLPLVLVGAIGAAVGAPAGEALPWGADVPVVVIEDDESESDSAPSEAPVVLATSQDGKCYLESLKTPQVDAVRVVVDGQPQASFVPGEDWRRWTLSNRGDVYCAGSLASATPAGSSRFSLSGYAPDGQLQWRRATPFYWGGLQGNGHYPKARNLHFDEYGNSVVLGAHGFIQGESVSPTWTALGAMNGKILGAIPTPASTQKNGERWRMTETVLPIPHTPYFLSQTYYTEGDVRGITYALSTLAAGRVLWSEDFPGGHQPAPTEDAKYGTHRDVIIYGMLIEDDIFALWSTEHQGYKQYLIPLDPEHSFAGFGPFGGIRQTSLGPPPEPGDLVAAGPVFTLIPDQAGGAPFRVGVLGSDVVVRRIGDADSAPVRLFLEPDRLSLDCVAEVVPLSVTSNSLMLWLHQCGGDSLLSQFVTVDLTNGRVLERSALVEGFIEGVAAGPEGRLAVSGFALVTENNIEAPLLVFDKRLKLAWLQSLPGSIWVDGFGDVTFAPNGQVLIAFLGGPDVAIFSKTGALLSKLILTTPASTKRVMISELLGVQGDSILVRSRDSLLWCSTQNGSSQTQPLPKADTTYNRTQTGPYTLSGDSIWYRHSGEYAQLPVTPPKPTEPEAK